MERVVMTREEDEMVAIRVADHARAPGGRYITDGPFSGEWFRNEILAGALREAVKRGEVVEVVLDSTSGYGSSFLEEAFGGLVRHHIVTPSDAKKYLKIVANSALYAPYKKLAERYINSAKPDVAVA
jgi:hypothetical protein